MPWYKNGPGFVFYYKGTLGVEKWIESFGFEDTGDWYNGFFINAGCLLVTDEYVFTLLKKEAQRRYGTEPIKHGTELKFPDGRIANIVNHMNNGWESLMFAKGKLSYYGFTLFDVRDNGKWTELVNKDKSLIEQAQERFPIGCKVDPVRENTQDVGNHNVTGFQAIADTVYGSKNGGPIIFEDGVWATIIDPFKEIKEQLGIVHSISIN